MIPGLLIKDLHDDEELIIEVRASNGQFEAATDLLYADLNSLETFAVELGSFPSNLNHTVTLEIGRPSSASYLLIKSFVYDAVGHCALEIHIQRNGADHYKAISKFSIQSQAASVNLLGEELKLWLKNRKDSFEWNAHA